MSDRALGGFVAWGAFAAPGLSPEQAAILGDLHRMIPDEGPRVAWLLHMRAKLTIPEVAAALQVSEGEVQRRLSMARKALKRDGATKKSRAMGISLR